MVECTLSITHCLRLNLQLHTIYLVRTCRISSFCTVAWQLARFQLTRRIARSFGDSWASCTFLVPAHPGSPGQRAVKRVCVCVSEALADGVLNNTRPTIPDAGKGFWRRWRALRSRDRPTAMCTCSRLTTASRRTRESCRAHCLHLALCRSTQQSQNDPWRAARVLGHCDQVTSRRRLSEDCSWRHFCLTVLIISYVDSYRET